MIHAKKLTYNDNYSSEGKMQFETDFFFAYENYRFLQ